MILPIGIRSGMTLVELLVGLVIVGAALSAGAAAFAGVADHRERATRALDDAAREALVRRTIMEWLRGLRIDGRQTGMPFAGMDGRDGDLPDDEVAFRTSAHTLAGAGDAYVRLHIDRDDETPERGLVAEIGDPDGRTGRIELAPQAVGLDARYLYGFRGRRWLPSWISTSVLPLAIEITLIAPDDDPLPPLLRRPLLVATGGSR